MKGLFLSNSVHKSV